jgi:hypothetical protein
MLKKSFITLFACALSTVSQADVFIINTTNTTGTAYSTYFGQCSSWLGSRGHIKKLDKMKIDQKYLNAFCEKQACDAEIHMSLDCSGEAIGKILFTKQEGITTVTPFDNSQGFSLRKIDNQTAIIEQTGTIRGLLRSVFR